MRVRIVVGVLAVLTAALFAASFGSVGAAPLGPVADTYVDAAAPAAHYGTKAYLRTDGSPLQRSYLLRRHGGLRSDLGGAAVLRRDGQQRGIEVHAVSSTTWGESTTSNGNAPATGDLLGSTGAFPAGTWLSVNVSSAITGNGLVSFALTTPASTGIRITSREGVNKPQLIVPAPAGPSPYLVSKAGSSYQAVSQTTGTTFTGTAKFVVEKAVADLEASGGGTVRFAAETFDLGSEYFKLQNVADIEFAGAGMDATVIRNNSSAAADTEPFNFSGAFRVRVRDLTVSAGGPNRNTSDALDFDRGNDVRVERVKVTASRGRAIVFDGKNADWTSLRNEVHDCVISGVDSDGIELLASSDNVIEGCTISDVGGHGIQVTKSSAGTDQPNKKSNDNQIIGNRIDQAGQDGINVTSSDRNQVLDNYITNSSDNTTGRDGIRLASGDSITCDDNRVAGNRATDTQSPKTQKYGLNISTSLCHRTVIGAGNDFSGNLAGAIRDAGTDTIS